MIASLPPIPPRPAEGHKGTFGTVLVVGGQTSPPADGGRVMIGGPAFTALAALRTGCGLAVLALPAPILDSGLIIAPSATGLALPVDAQHRLRASEVADMLDRHMGGVRCLAVGPGFGADQPQQQIIMRLLARDETPLVLDADGINALAQVSDFQADLRAPLVLTPHPGEYRRLAERLGISADPIDPAQRPEAAMQLAQRLGCVVVLKGHRTVISDGVTAFINETGGAALGTAGTGDVLTGMIASLIAQHSKPALGSGARQITPHQQGGLSLLDCARLAVHLHGMAGDLWTSKHGEAGLLASDLIELIPACLNQLRR